MRFGPTLLVSLAFGVVSGLGPASMVTAQTSIGFRDPGDMEALLSYRLPDWGYRTSSFQLGIFGNGEDVSGCYYCGDAATTNASEALTLQWYRESEQRTWALGVGQRGFWFWNQYKREGDERIFSQLRGEVFVQGFNRNYPTDNFFLSQYASATGSYLERRRHEESGRELAITRSFEGDLRLGLGLGRMRDVTPVVQAQRVSERLQALGHEPLPVEDVLRLASVLAQNGGYQRVFDRPDRQLWRDVLEPLIGRGETLTPFEIYYLGDVFNEVLGSRREGLLFELSGQVERATSDNEPSSGSTHAGPRLLLDWSHNLNLDHQLSASWTALASYVWLDDYFLPDSENKTASTSLYLQHQWVVADRFRWSNALSGALTYEERTEPDRRISRERAASVSSSFLFFVEDHVRVGPTVLVDYRRPEVEGDWNEYLSWSLQLNITYDFDNALF